MDTPRNEQQSNLHQTFWATYTVGLLLCVLWPLLLQFFLGRGIEPGDQAFEGIFRDIGYTFTLLSLALAFLAQRRFKRLRNTFASLAPNRQAFKLGREILLHSVSLAITTLFGLALYRMCGAQAERYARSFILLAPLLFLLLVPRLGTWERALQKPEVTH